MNLETRAKEIFLDALECERAGRVRFVADACADDAALRERVEGLLRADERAEGRMARATVHVLEAGTHIGSFELLAPLGEGGFGVVWRARQEVPVRREVALKVLRSTSAEAAARFARERQALAALAHPSIAQVFDGGTDHGRPWFAMELVDGVPITKWVERERANLDTRLALFSATARAVQHAHQRGVIHRDIKPSNVLVRALDGMPQVKVIDFGIARVTDDMHGDAAGRTIAGEVLGTPGYMSPEQIDDTRDVDTRTDVYALGVLLYEMIVSAGPFDTQRLHARGPSEALRILRQEEPPRPSDRARALGFADRARELRGDLDWIVGRCLEKDRERRYASVAELVADVERHRAGEAVLAGPPSRVYRARKFARRHALVLGALGAVALALVGGSTWALVELRRARRAERAEASAAETARLEVERFQAIAEFLEHVLLSIDPAVAKGRDVTILRDVLDKAVAGIADRGDRPPAVEASLRRVIGGAYASLAEYDAALPQLERALELRRASLGDAHADTIASLGEYAGVVMHAGRLREAEQPLADALTRARTTFGDDDERTLVMLGNQAALQRALYGSTAALATMRELEERRVRTLGAEHDKSLLATNNLALALLEEGRTDEALARLERVMQAQVRLHGEAHPRSLAAMGNYASALQDADRREECEALLRKVIALKTALLGAEHPSVHISQNNLAQLCEDSGRFEEALALLDATLVHSRPGSDQTAKLRINRSDVLRRMGRAADAAAEARAALADAVASTGEGSPLALTCEQRLRDALADAEGAGE